MLALEVALIMGFMPSGRKALSIRVLNGFSLLGVQTKRRETQVKMREVLRDTLTFRMSNSPLLGSFAPKQERIVRTFFRKLTHVPSLRKWHYLYTCTHKMWDTGDNSTSSSLCFTLTRNSEGKKDTWKNVALWQHFKSFFFFLK